MYIHIHIYIYIYVNVYIYIERERDAMLAPICGKAQVLRPWIGRIRERPEPRIHPIRVASNRDNPRPVHVQRIHKLRNKKKKRV